MENLEIKIIKFYDIDVRVITDDNNVTLWFVAIDLGPLINHKDIVRVINSDLLDDDERIIMYLKNKFGYWKKHYLVNESGAYKATGRYNLLKAKEFTKHFTSVVLPEIRRGNKELIQKNQLLNAEKVRKSELARQISELDKQIRNSKYNIEQLEADIFKICPPITPPKQLDLLNQ